jgi:hypothetical protein
MMTSSREAGILDSTVEMGTRPRERVRYAYHPFLESE